MQVTTITIWHDRCNLHIAICREIVGTTVNINIGDEKPQIRHSGRCVYDIFYDRRPRECVNID